MVHRHLWFRQIIHIGNNDLDLQVTTVFSLVSIKCHLKISAVQRKRYSYFSSKLCLRLPRPACSWGSMMRWAVYVQVCHWEDQGWFLLLLLIADENLLAMSLIAIGSPWKFWWNKGNGAFDENFPQLLAHEVHLLSFSSKLSFLLEFVNSYLWSSSFTGPRCTHVHDVNKWAINVSGVLWSSFIEKLHSKSVHFLLLILEEITCLVFLEVWFCGSIDLLT